MLRGINVIEMAGLGPVTMCGLILRDFGASVLRVFNPNAPFTDQLLSSDKATVALNLKSTTDREKFINLCKSSDILLDPFRPNCLEKLGITTQLLHKANKGLILTRISGYDQPEENESMDYYLRPGHDINYLAESGILSMFSSEKNTSAFPANVIADVAGGSFPAVAGTILALYNREKSGIGKIVDVSITDGVAYLATYFMALLQESSRQILDHSNAHWHILALQCRGLLDGNAPFYRTYETKDKKAVAIGALEPQFYANLLKTLGISEKYAPQLDRHAWPRIVAIFSGIFASETRDYWCTETDLVRNACLSPVYSMEEALQMQPKHLYRDLSFSFSPLAGATRNESAFSFRIPRPCPVISDFPPE